MGACDDGEQDPVDCGEPRQHRSGLPAAQRRRDDLGEVIDLLDRCTETLMGLGQPAGSRG